MLVSRLDACRVLQAKTAFSARRVKQEDIKNLLCGDIRPAPGDLVLARIDELGKQTRLELTDGRRAFLYPGDEIIVAYGNRYAPDQYEALIGQDLSPCDLVAAGGLAAVELARHKKVIMPTQISPLGLLADEAGRRINLADYRVDRSSSMPPIPAVLSLGTSMNAGKSLTAASLVKGFKRLGHRVASLKITGTGSGGDLWIAQDAGADVVADFTDAGFPSTYLVPIADLETAAYRLMNHAAEAGCDIAVIEIADGLQQLETAALIKSPAIQRIALATVFAAYDSMGAYSGVETLKALGHDLISLSGKIGLTPLGVREAEAATGLKYHSPFDIQDGVLIPLIRRKAAEKLVTNPDGMDAALSALSRDLTDGGDVRMSSAASHASSGVPKKSEAERQAAQRVLQLVADFIVKCDVKRLQSSEVGNGSRVRQTTKFQHRIWDSGLGLIHLLVPNRSNYRPSFLDTTINEELVDTVIETLGERQFMPALHRLVCVLGGVEYERYDLRPLGDAVVKLCADVGITGEDNEPEAPLTIDAFEAARTRIAIMRAELDATGPFPSAGLRPFHANDDELAMPIHHDHIRRSG